MKNQYVKDYSEKGFLDKCKKYAKAAGKGILEPAAKLFYAAQDPDTPAWAKTTIYGALGYFISPLDAIPDFTPVVGYSDDLSALALALTTVAAHIKPKHKQQARQKINEWLS